MYIKPIEPGSFSTTIVQIKYDCCGKEHSLKLKDAQKNFEKNKGRHFCRPCWLRNNNPAKSQSAKEKAKTTIEKKYGGVLPMNSPKLIEERKEQFKDEKFKKAWIEKHRETSLEKYGVSHPMHTEEVKEKQRQTMQAKYGVDHPLQNPDVVAKMQATNRKKYGVSNVASLPEVQNKMAATSMDRSNVSDAS